MLQKMASRTMQNRGMVNSIHQREVFVGIAFFAISTFRSSTGVLEAMDPGGVM